MIETNQYISHYIFMRCICHVDQLYLCKLNLYHVYVIDNFKHFIYYEIDHS